MRIFLGFFVAGLALGAAVWIHDGWKAESYTYHPVVDGRVWRVDSTGHRRAGWQDPLAVVLAFAGVGAGVALVVPALRRTA